MSDSYRTQKESVLAARRIKRNSQGEPIYPRIIVKPPSKGDVHPLTKQTLNRLLRQIPIEYVYGLRRIELQGRLNTGIGHPFGLYLPDEKVVRLFSLPTEWRLKKLGKSFRSSLLKFYAEISEEDESVIVNWPDQNVMTLWYYCDVFTHELGHHFRCQYRHKNGGLGSRIHEEFVAELHAKRFTDALFRKYCEKKAAT
jgi:hypothetical protein